MSTQASVPAHRSEARPGRTSDAKPIEPRSRRWRWLLVTSVACVGGVVALAPRKHSPSPKAGPSEFPVTVSATELNFGTVLRGTRAEREFWVCNTSPHPLKLTRLETSCDCLQIHLARNTLRPGERV